MDVDIGILTQVLNAYNTVLSAGYSKIVGDAYFVLKVLAVIELTLAGLWWALDKEDMIQGLIQKIMLLGFFFFLITQWPDIAKPVVDSLIGLGLKASGDTIPIETVSDPSLIAHQGLRICDPIIQYTSSLGITSIGSLIMLGLTMLITLLAFFYVSILVMVVQIEYYLVSLFAIIFLPFGVFQKTSWLSDGVLKAVVVQGVRLMVLYTIVAIALPVFQAIPANLPKEKLMFSTAVAYLVAALSLAYLASSATSLAQGIVSGMPSLYGGGAIQSAASTMRGIGVAGASVGLHKPVTAAGKAIGGGMTRAVSAAGGAITQKAKDTAAALRARLR